MSTLQDISGLAGNPICIFAALAFLLIGKTAQFLQIVLALLLVYAIVIPIRYVWFKPRPKPMRWHTFLERVEANSLVSVHTARATILAFVFSMYFGQLSVGILFAALIPLVAVSRILLQKHRLEDLIFGFLVGAGV
ncbi:MAG: phosphatase PAP2 family protein, partial [DPANN group archaeon]|nr:phosphatase PAP2 family protein [DPANN group archaeon]